ncbi:MAG TPA: phytoene desaturase family protein [Acidimicrobiales bacterium]|jgi:phytoene desaturase|nr:phytoene desaturase family protein [Acidimicrobiales bacterium]
MSDRAVVVGAGLGGLSAACHLRARGWEVDVVERASQPGGRAGRVTRNGYCFDTGPTVMTMPEFLADAFHAIGADMDDFVTMQRLDPAYRAVFDDGSELRVRAERSDMLGEVERVCGREEAAAFERYCKWLTSLHVLETPGFLDRNYDGPLDLVRPLGPALRLLRLGGLRRLRATVDRAFGDERLRRLFSFQSLYAGVTPQQALSLLAVISYMDVVAGVWAVEGGMHAIPTALATAAEKAGVRFHFGVNVERIALANGDRGPVRAVVADHDVLPADAVVVNADIPAAYGLVPGLRRPSRLRRHRYAPSAVVWHVGLRGSPSDAAAHHNIHFGRAWHSGFRALVHDGVRMPDPSILVSVPTVTSPDLAPPRGSVLYALEPVPNLEGRVDWATARASIREDLEHRLVADGYLSGEIEEELLVDPVDWARMGLVAGTPFSLSHTFLQSGPFRPRNVEPRAPGLVFAGSGTVPGVGVPMVLLSGKLAAERIGRPE